MSSSGRTGSDATRVSAEAREILAASGAVELHLESFIWTRVFGYDLSRRHGAGPLGARLFSQLDLPRLLDSGLTSSVWSIATNPLRPRGRRTAALLENVRRLVATLEAHERCAVVLDGDEHDRALENGLHACWIAIQGGNALDSVEDLDLLPDGLVRRITLVHMSDSHVGGSSNPLGGLAGERGLTGFGRDLVRAMDTRRILVDLAHVSPEGFRDALEVHDPSLPVVVSHTGVRGVHDLWRNVSDDQIRAVAGTGGVVGIIAHAWALGPVLRRVPVDAMVEHMEHVIRLVGDEHVALGCDWDGFIVTPHDMRTVDRLPVLVQRMLDRRFSPERITRILSTNALRLLGSGTLPATR
jgi:membrane dipeptidase